MINLIGKIGSKKEHMLIKGDNLIALEHLQEDYKDKIHLIYIDPPYNTGKKMGQYNDNFKTHETWVSFMRPRLILAKKYLSDDGLIFISIGEHEEAHLKILCNEIFGEENKISSIIWQSKYTIANDKKGISTQTEYIIVYAKDAKCITINNDPLRDEYVKSNYKNADNDPRGLWRGGVQLYKKKNPHSYTVTSPAGKSWTMPWNYSEKNWKEVLEKNNLLYWGKDGDSCPVKKVFLKDTKGTGIKNLWLGEDVGYTADGDGLLEKMFGNRNQFLYSKPVSLMKRILKIAAKHDSLVMDFFAGSGTLGQAVLEVNKELDQQIKFILITNNENNICDETTFPRLKNIIEGYVNKDGLNINATGGNLEFVEIV